MEVAGGAPPCPGPPRARRAGSGKAGGRPTRGTGNFGAASRRRCGTARPRGSRTNRQLRGGGTGLSAGTARQPPARAPQGKGEEGENPLSPAPPRREERGAPGPLFSLWGSGGLRTAQRRPPPAAAPALTQVVPPQQAGLLQPQAPLPHVPQQVWAVPAGHGPARKGRGAGREGCRALRGYRPLRAITMETGRPARAANLRARLAPRSRR